MSHGIPSTKRTRRWATFASAALALAAASATFAAPAHAVIPNDNFANATVVEGMSFGVSPNMAGTDSEANEPRHGGLAPGSTAWYSWTAPTDAKVTLSGYGYNFDFATVTTAVGIYTGSTLTGLTTIVSKSGSSWSSSFSAVGGRTYRIALAGPLDDTFRIEFSLNAVPKNDPFAAPRTISGTSGNLTGSNVNAGRESSEPDHAGLTGGASVWYSWTAPSAGQARVTTAGSNFDTLLGVYRGGSIGGLTTVASNDDCETPEGVSTSCVTFNATAGTTYRIAVDGYNFSTGQIRLAWNLGGGGGGSCTINGTSGNDVLVGTSGADVICGLGGDDQIKGQGGDDTLIGGAGTDAASYADATASVTANLTTGTATGQGTDTFEGIENLIGSSRVDKLDGDAGANTLNGGGGGDGLFGQGGNDNLLGGDGDDTLGGTGGDDRLNGGLGADTAHFGRAAGVTVNLATGTSTGEGRDALVGIENVYGSPGADRVTGSAAVNLVRGNAGADNLSGAGGNDSLFGFAGNDTLAGGAGADRCDGGSDRDTADASCETKVSIP